MLVRLLYASRAAGNISGDVIKAILTRSREHNPKNGITGVLCTCQSGDVFMQVLEGSRDAVNRLYANIGRDSRHHTVTLLYYSEIGERRFAGWRMGSVDLNRVNQSTILRFSEKPALDPFTMTGEGAMALLSELISTAAIVSRDDCG